MIKVDKGRGTKKKPISHLSEKEKKEKKKALEWYQPT